MIKHVAGNTLITINLIIVLMLSSCGTKIVSKEGKEIPSQLDSYSINQLAKTDLDRLADVQMRETTESLKLLMVKLYKRNPNELKKSTSGSVDDMVAWVFQGGHHWQFDDLKGSQGVDAIQLAFKADFQKDRVLAYIVGLQTMIIKASGGKTEFYMTDSIDPQKIYNAARNVEVAYWKLTNARDSNGQLYLLTNEMNDHERNLSFEREIGKIIGRLDLYAFTLAEKYQRMITRVTQSIATAIFIPL